MGSRPTCAIAFHHSEFLPVAGLCEAGLRVSGPDRPHRGQLQKSAPRAYRNGEGDDALELARDVRVERPAEPLERGLDRGRRDGLGADLVDAVPMLPVEGGRLEVRVRTLVDALTLLVLQAG